MIVAMVDKKLSVDNQMTFVHWIFQNSSSDFRSYDFLIMAISENPSMTMFDRLKDLLIISQCPVTFKLV